MRRMFFFSFLALLVGCSENPPLDPLVGPELTVIAAADGAMRTRYVVQTAPDPACTGCTRSGIPRRESISRRRGEPEARIRGRCLSTRHTASLIAYATTAFYWSFTRSQSPTSMAA